MSSPPSKARKWASVRKKFNLIVAHRSSSPERSSPSPASTLSAESQAASFCRPYTANPSSVTTTTLEAPPRSPRPVSSPVAFPVHFPHQTPTPTPTPPPAPIRSPVPTLSPAPVPASKPKPSPSTSAANKHALLSGELNAEPDPDEEALLAPTTAAEAEWDRLTKANSEMNNNLDLYGTASDAKRGLRKRAKSRVRRKKGVRFSEGEDVIGLGGFEVWTTDEEDNYDDEEVPQVQREVPQVQREVPQVQREVPKVQATQGQGGKEGFGGQKRDVRVEVKAVEVRVPMQPPAREVRAPPPPPPPRPQSLPPMKKPQVQVSQGLAAPGMVPKRPPPQMLGGSSEKRDMSRKILPPSVRLVQDDGSF